MQGQARLRRLAMDGATGPKLSLAQCSIMRKKTPENEPHWVWKSETSLSSSNWSLYQDNNNFVINTDA